MLLEEFDKSKNAVINPEIFVKKLDDMPKTCISFFSKTLYDNFIEKYHPQMIANLSNASNDRPVYKFNYKGVDLAFYRSPIGSPACAVLFEEVIALGIKNMLLFGCCGCLDDKIGDYSIILPTSALRDEGTSYFYLPQSDEVELDKKGVQILEDVMKENEINYHKGKTWTTDAFYRETLDRVQRRKQQGAITVEMECSAMTAIAKFRGVNFAQFFYAADNLNEKEYDPRSLVKDEFVSQKKEVLELGLECAIAIDKNFAS